MAAPAVGLVSRLSAAAAPSVPPSSELSALDTMKLGETLLNQHRFEQAQLMLDKVRLAALSDAQCKQLAQLKSEVAHALEQRQLAQTQYKQAIEAQRAGRMIEARGLYQTVADNRFVDAATAQNATLGIAGKSGDAVRVVTAVSDTPAADAAPADTLTSKQHYQLALKEYRAGDWVNARKDFEGARDYKPGLFEGDRPDVYLARMDKKEGADRANVRSTQANLRAINAGMELQQDAGAAATQPSDQALDVLRNAARAEDLRRQQNAAQAQQLVRDAAAAVEAGNLDSARDKYSEATRLDPSNAQAQAGLRDVLTRQGRNPDANQPLNQVEQDIRARKQEIHYRFDTSIEDAGTAVSNHEFGQADIALQRAQVAATTDRSIFTAEELHDFDSRIAATRARLDSERQITVENNRRQQGTEAQRQLEDQRRQAEQERRRTIADLKQSARNLSEQARYKEALGVVDQVLVLDPNDEYAVGVRQLLQDRVNLYAQRTYMEQRTANMTLQWNAAEEKLIPYDDILRYPPDWPDISALRDQTVASERGDNKEDRAAQAQLDRTLPELSFEGVAFGDVVDFLRDVSGANIFVNWKALETAGIDRNAPVTLKLRNVRFSKALTLILNNVAAGGTQLGYTIDQGVISISTGDELAKNTLTRVYDIRDLIINIPDFTDAPSFDLTSLSNQSQNSGTSGGASGVGGGGSSGGNSSSSQGLFGGSGGAGQGGNRESAGPTRQELVDQITKLITDTVAPDTWRDAGGSVGSMRELQGSLIVTQTPENQHALMNLLEQLREQRAIQITVETRFLTIQRNFLEDVGLDLNFIFNLNASWSKNFSQIPLTTPPSSFTAGPTTSVPGSIGSSASSLTTSATYLDDFQVQLLLRATQAQQTSTIVQAPRITLYNGQRAYVLVALQQAYVSNLTAAVGTGVSAFQPTVATLQSGVLLDVVATVSADRKYVTLTLRPELANLIDLKSFTFQTGTSAAATGGGLLTAAVQTAPTGTIQQPELQITEVKTTVTVPDGGTLLLGGQTVAGELEKEVGVPVLSKIPFLKRLFTNRSMAKDEQVLLILVKPTILITREIEQKQFPLLTSKLGG